MTRITGPATQSFREERSSRTFTIDALYDKKTGQHVIRWTDVLQVCKGASYVSSNGKLVPFLTDEDLENLIPLRIAYQQDTIFDVVFAATAHIMDISSYNTTAVDGTAHIQATTHQISNLSIASDDPFKALVVLGSDTADLTPRAQVSFMAYSQLYKSFLAAVKAGQQTQVVEIKSAMDVHFDRLQQEMDRNHNLLVQLRDLQQKIDDQQQEMLNMQRQTLNHLAVIQNRLQAILTRTTSCTSTLSHDSSSSSRNPNAVGT
ncbi:hypothetical protein BGZ99_000495 [Dissophora globulifera]|uniref:Uncharacterized protein n=1 Tax=Dissophora globulifera TaxID=979702 RepID=A0A9P6UZI7_9FUNG|nr:hypothetical protein BGZ99_000495 [Dissophora globulifera]